MKPEFLNRYTTLPVLLDMLWREQVILLSPKSWEDWNDAYYLERYKENRKLAAVLALCFSTKRETFHHWRIFAHGNSGVCIEFDADELLSSIPTKIKGFRSGYVEYSRIDTLERAPPAVSRWPFLKRQPFADESEFRIIYESPDQQETSKPIQIELESIKRITLSPWMPKSVAESVKKTIDAIPSCSGIHVHRSTLIENGRWRKIVDE